MHQNVKRLLVLLLRSLLNLLINHCQSRPFSCSLSISPGIGEIRCQSEGFNQVTLNVYTGAHGSNGMGLWGGKY